MQDDKKIWDSLTPQWKQIMLKNYQLQHHIQKLPANSFWNGVDKNYEKLGLDILKTEEPNAIPTKIDVFASGIESIHPLSQTYLLEEFYCGNTGISDLSPLGNNVLINKLCCYNTPLTNLNGLQGLSSLTRLCISKTDVSDLSPISKLFKLEKLAFYKTQVEDLRPLVNLKNLQKINMNFTQVTDISPLFELSLKELHCYTTKVDESQLIAFRSRFPQCQVITDYEQPESEYDDFE